MDLLWQHLLVAIAVLASASYVVSNRAPQFTRRLRVALTLQLVAASRPTWMRALGRRIAPAPVTAACGGCDSSCHHAAPRGR